MASLGAIPQLVQNPTVGYRLDPGEPGLAPPATATNSVYTVVAQESHNRARLQANAQLQGQDVLLVKTDYKVARVGSFNVVVGGHTTVVSRARSDESSGSGVLSPPADAATAEQPGASRKVLQLTLEEQRLETERRELDATPAERDPVEVARATSRRAAIEQRLREIASELRDLGVMPGAGGLSPAAAFAASGLAAQLDVTGRLLDLTV